MHNRKINNGSPDKIGVFRDGGAGVVLRRILKETHTPDGVRVVVFHDTWYGHILKRAGRVELASHLPDVLQAVAAPDLREPDAWPRERSRERFYKRGAGPSLWLMVVVDYEREPARIVTALGCGHGRAPRGWTSRTADGPERA